MNFVCTAEPCLWQNRWFFLHQTLNGTVVHAAPIAFVHDSFQPQWSSRPRHISAYQHITFTASLWLCMTSCLQRGSGLINRRIQPANKIHSAYSSSQSIAVRCACVVPPFLLYTGNVFNQKEKKRKIHPTGWVHTWKLVLHNSQTVHVFLHHFACPEVRLSNEKNLTEIYFWITCTHNCKKITQSRQG